MHSVYQLEALQEGTELNTVKYLNTHPFRAIIIFVIAITTAALWAEVLIYIVSTYVLGRQREEMTAGEWIVFAISFTVFAWLTVVFAFGLPITAAFSL